ncbi:heparan-sulfate 6-O-sulfotransferase 2-like [Acipenser oxyrinchus oxyrinchus]|uniref:Heparan-sulfate 6-O-sulfotransferase n=1 Tax=Acipenser oxyrinchus oxyrinchus TaxID=40147 RepID=A0AAD8D5T7_ACIOX|nr:heparan-sulfate 6-O-sulfotransferase 2-like [Acipenser oxyrinchus oxyrinchus]
MDDKPSKLLLALVMLCLFGVIVLQYVCPGTECQLLLRLHAGWGSSSSAGGAAAFSGGGGDPYRAEDGTLSRFVPRFHFSEEELRRAVDFNIKGDDVIVFLHIQKTGGTTFGRHLVRNILLEQPCECRAGQKKCTCLRPGKKETWLFSRFSTGWSCGLHADWTELTNCVPGLMDITAEPTPQKPRRNYYYITILRDPVSRYLSEWRHVQRGATWKASLHVCDGRAPTPSELPTCYSGDDWSGCTLADFMDCPYNLASNRQARMLADLSLVGCYNLSVMGEEQRSRALLESAKRNLKEMAFFGLTEFQRKTQYLFERTFHMRFISPFTQFNSTRATSVEVEPETQRRIRELNILDVELYEYARDLFLQRFQSARQQEHREARRRRQQERRQLLRGRLQWVRQEEEEELAWGQEENSTGGDYMGNVERWRR